MRKFLKLTALAGMLMMGAEKAAAQVDPHFSQYYVYPSWLNPALTGAFDGSYRISGIYRNQWSNIINPYSTPGIAADFRTTKNIHFGASILNESAGDGGYNYLTGYISAAFTGVRFGKDGNQHIAFGLQAGIVNRRFNRDKLHFGDQWNPITGYNPGVPSADVLTRNSASTFDAGAGILYYDGTPGRKANVYGGFSASHLTRPEDPFSVGSKEKLPIRYTVHAGVRIQAGDNFTITPNALYLRQGNADEKMLGAYGQFKATNEFDFLLGGNWRFNDAISPYVGFYYKSMTLGLSYDVNVSDLGKMTRSANSFEVSLTLTGKRKAKMQEENFVCPRL
jgi:type IX secretion system PorP/SprF family membrane protein